MVALLHGGDPNFNSLRNLSPNRLNVIRPALYFHDCHKEADASNRIWLFTLFDSVVREVLSNLLRGLPHLG